MRIRVTPPQAPVGRASWTPVRSTSVAPLSGRMSVSQTPLCPHAETVALTDTVVPKTPAKGRMWGRLGVEPAPRVSGTSGRPSPCARQLRPKCAVDRREALAACAVGGRTGQVGADALAHPARVPVEVELDQLELGQHRDQASADLRGARVAAAARERGLDGIGGGLSWQCAQGAVRIRQRGPEVE